MKIIGYGEDSLTLWALKNRLKEILEKLGDNTTPAKCLVIYRPSFGRRGGNGSSQFGEFDAILGTFKSTYLIESKRARLKESKRNDIRLNEVQVRRHKIFTYYLKKWRELNPDNWTNFSNRIRKDFKKEFGGKPIPRGDTLLARNFIYILEELKPYNSETSNVLLFLHGPNLSTLPSSVNPSSFRLIKIECDYLNKGGYIKL